MKDTDIYTDSNTGIWSFAAGLAAGALVMYWADPASGARRRAMARDKLLGAGHDAADRARATGKRAADHLRGFAATRSLDRVTRSEPQSDSQLHERIRARLGRVVSHPKAINVEVHQGRVSLTGSILTSELEPLLREVQDTAGLKALHNQLTCHPSAEGIPELQGRAEPPGRESRSAHVS